MDATSLSSSLSSDPFYPPSYVLPSSFPDNKHVHPSATENGPILPYSPLEEVAACCCCPCFLKAKINAVGFSWMLMEVCSACSSLWSGRNLGVPSLSGSGGCWWGASLFMNYLRTNISPWSELLFFQRQCQSGTEEQSIFQCINVFWAWPFY